MANDNPRKSTAAESPADPDLRPETTPNAAEENEGKHHHLKGGGFLLTD